MVFMLAQLDEMAVVRAVFVIVVGRGVFDLGPFLDLLGRLLLFPPRIPASGRQEQSPPPATRRKCFPTLCLESFLYELFVSPSRPAAHLPPFNESMRNRPKRVF